MALCDWAICPADGGKGSIIVTAAATSCASLGWDRVRFLHSSWYGVMLWICDGNRDVLVIAEQLIQSQGLLSSSPHQQAGWGCTRSWEGHR